MNNNSPEQTLVLIKPDALLNSLTGYILSTLAEIHTGLRFAGAKVVSVHKILAEEHYAEHKGKPFYEPLLGYIMGHAHYPDIPERRRVIAIVLRGPEAIKKIRRIAGPTDPHVARKESPGTLRALGTVAPIKDSEGNVIDKQIDNLIHASASVSDAEREIKLWFKPCDIPPFKRDYPVEVSDTHYYLKDGKLSATYEPGCICVVAPGDEAWRSDLETLQLISSGAKAASTLETVTAKYLINKNLENLS